MNRISVLKELSCGFGFSGSELVQKLLEVTESYL